MSKLGRGASFISKEIRKTFSSFYLFGDGSSIKKDLVGKNDLTFSSGGSSEIFYGRNGRGEKFTGGKYLENRAITPTVTGFPLFIYADVQDEKDQTLDNEIISLSPWITNYTRSFMLFREQSSNDKVRAIMTDGGFSSYSNSSKSIPSRFYTAALLMRSITDFILFVNGERLTQYSTNASGFTTKNSIVVGANSNGSSGFVGGIFSCGWGTIDPGEDFLRRLTVDPTSTIFQGISIPRKAGIVIGAKQRRTLSVLGTQAGKRQAQP